MRKDTPPGLKVAADMMKTRDFKALSLSAQNTNTINQSLALDLLGIKYQAVPAYRGLKEVETAILQNIGQLANSSLSGWSGSVEPTMGDIVAPLWQLSPRGKDGSYPRSEALPNLPTFEEFYASVRAARSRRAILRGAARSSDPQLAMFRVAMMPPKPPDEAVAIMRSAFVEMWKDPQFSATIPRSSRPSPFWSPATRARRSWPSSARSAPRSRTTSSTTRIAWRRNEPRIGTESERWSDARKQYALHAHRPSGPAGDTPRASAAIAQQKNESVGVLGRPPAFDTAPSSKAGGGLGPAQDARRAEQRRLQEQEQRRRQQEEQSRWREMLR